MDVVLRRRGPTRSPAGWSSARALLVVTGATVATRLPFVFASPGAGVDPDAWRLLTAGRETVDTGVYHLSRTPGYPLVELASAAMAGLPIWSLLLVTCLVGAAGVAAFADLLRTLEVRAWVPWTIACAATPVVYRSQVTFMDHAWAFTAVMVSFALLARRRWAFAGAAFGAAVAARPSSVVLVFVVVAVMAGVRAPRAAWLQAVAAGAAVAGLFWVVPLATFGQRLAFVVDESVGLVPAVGRATTQVWGWLGAVVVIAATLAATYAWWRSPRPAAAQRVWLVAFSVGVVSVIALFARLPADPGYLIPAVPMVLAGMALLLTRPWAWLVAGAVAVSSFAAPPGIVFGVTMLRDRDARAERAEFTANTLRAVRNLPPGSVVVTGAGMPELVAAEPVEAVDVPSFGERVVLPGGQVLVYRATSPSAPSTAPSTWRTGTVRGAEPLVPGAPTEAP